MGLFLLLFMAVAAGTVHGGSAGATSPVDEIRALVEKKVLWPPSPLLLKGLEGPKWTEGLKSIDPWARYVPPQAPGKSPEKSLGIEVFAHDQRLWIRPEPEGPADRAGLPEVSLFLALNGVNMEHVDLPTASSALDRAIERGHVRLTIADDQGGEKKTIAVSPKYFPAKSLTWRRANGCFLIRIAEFEAYDTAPSLAALYETSISPGDKVFIDLRDCSGGELMEAVEIAGMFVPEGLPLFQMLDRSKVVKAYRSTCQEKLPLPTAVLIDGDTASAAEVFAGILKHYHLSLLMGRRSFGKGVSQTWFPLSSGGGLWLTTHFLRLPGDSPKIEQGLTPDISIIEIDQYTLSDICNDQHFNFKKSRSPYNSKVSH